MTTEYTQEQVQQAKDFIWNNLAQHNKDLQFAQMIYWLSIQKNLNK
jgi:hypothetical protein